MVPEFYSRLNRIGLLDWMGSSLSSPTMEDRALTLQHQLHAEQHPKTLKPSPSPSPSPATSTSCHGESNSNSQVKRKPWLPFSKALLLSSRPGTADDFLPLQLLGKHQIGPNTLVETAVRGTKVQLEELRLSIIQKITNMDRSKHKHVWNDGLILLSALTDFNNQHRVTMESMLGSEGNNLMFAAVLSTDFESAMSWGLANFYRPFKTVACSTKFAHDTYSGNTLNLQGIQQLNDNSKLSILYTIGDRLKPQLSLGWTFQSNENSIDFKASCNTDGLFSVNVKAQVGEQ